jgi:hypothetical protein
MLGKPLIATVVGLCYFVSNAAAQNYSLGIQRTEQAMNKIVDQIEENNKDLAKLAADESFDYLLKTQGAEKASDLIGSFGNGYHFTDALQTGQYATAIQNAAEFIASIWGKSPTWDGRAVEFGSDAIHYAGVLYEAQSLVRQNMNLTNTWWVLANQDARLKGLQMQNAASLYKAFSPLNGTHAMDAAFSEWLKANNVTRSSVLASTMRAAGDGDTAFQVASGMTGEDIPWLTFLPNINPDFLFAIQRQRDLLSGTIDFAHVEAAGAVDKYSNGSFINAFGKPQGTVIVVPVELRHDGQPQTVIPQQITPADSAVQGCNSCFKGCITAWDLLGLLGCENICRRTYGDPACRLSF